MTLSRRSVLQMTALAAASGLAPLPGLGRLLFGAESQDKRILVVLHLRGGCDGLNLLSPAADADFIAARNSDLRVLTDGDEAGHLISHLQEPKVEFRLHTAAKSLAELADAKHLAFIHAAGLTDTTRSHFVATDMIEHGVADGASLNRTGTGWLARAMLSAPGSGMVRGVSLSRHRAAPGAATPRLFRWLISPTVWGRPADRRPARYSRRCTAARSILAAPSAHAMCNRRAG
jgi:uncharacterized protein (DUF1501 family)